MVWLPCCWLLPSSTYCVLAFSTPGLLNKSFFRNIFLLFFVTEILTVNPVPLCKGPKLEAAMGG
jgi:hypothetical protein